MSSILVTNLLTDVDAVNINRVISHYGSGYKTRYTSFAKNITFNNKKDSLNRLADKYTDDWLL